jgi:serine/threonine-protein kinase
MKTTTLFTMTGLCIVFGFSMFSCEKKDSTLPSNSTSTTTTTTTTTKTPLAVSAINPVEAGALVQVTIKGTGFSDTLSHDSVYFNGVKATLVSVDTASIVATVPIGAGTGKVTVFVNGTSLAGPVFTYDSTYIVTTLAGGQSRGYVDGTGTAAAFNTPIGLVTDANGNIYVTDNSNAIRKITPSGVVTTFAGGATAGSADGTGTGASFNSLDGIAIDGAGNLYVCDGGNRKIRKITQAGVVTTLAGSGNMGATDGPGSTATFVTPSGICVDNAGNVYVADQSYESLIRMITPAGVVSTLAGNSTTASIDGLGTAASFSYPIDIAVDGNGTLYVTEGHDTGISNTSITLPSYRIRKIASGGIVTTLAGSATVGDLDGTGTAATFNIPAYLCTDANGNIYVSEAGGVRIRMVTPAGVVTTFAGSGTPGKADGPAKVAQFGSPSGISIDGNGNIYVADPGGVSIRKISRQ